MSVTKAKDKSGMGEIIYQDCDASIYCHVIQTYQDGQCWLYTVTEGEFPYIIATAIVKHTGYLMWIEVSSEWRRMGWGARLLKVMADRHELTVSPGSQLGDKWVPAIMKQFPQVTFAK